MGALRGVIEQRGNGRNSGDELRHLDAAPDHTWMIRRRLKLPVNES